MPRSLWKRKKENINGRATLHLPHPLSLISVQVLFSLFGWNNTHSYPSFISPQLTDAVNACKVWEDDEFSNYVKKNLMRTSSSEALSRCKNKGCKGLMFMEIFTVWRLGGTASQTHCSHVKTQAQVALLWPDVQIRMLTRECLPALNLHTKM